MKKKIYIIAIILILTLIIGYKLYNKYFETGIIYGNKDADIEIVNYTSFECVSCTLIHERLHKVISKYINTGEIKFIEKPIDIKRFKFDDIIYKHMSEKQMTDFEELYKIYKSQEQWKNFKNEDEVKEFLKLDKNINKKNEKDITRIDKEIVKLNIKEVPAMYINGEKISNHISVEEFEAKIEMLLKDTNNN